MSQSIPNNPNSQSIHQPQSESECLALGESFSLTVRECQSVGQPECQPERLALGLPVGVAVGLAQHVPECQH